MVFFLRSFFAQTLLNTYFVFRIWKSRELPRYAKILLSGVYASETILYFTGLFCSQQITVETFALIQKINGIWVIAHVYLGGLLLCFDLIYLINKKRRLFIHLKDKTIRRIKIYTFLIFFLFIGSQLYIGYENFLHPRVRTFSYAFNSPPAPGALPRYRYKLLVASDLHLGYIIDKKVLQQYVEIINAQQADIVVIDGDLIDYTLRPLVATRMDEDLRKIRAPKGVYFIPGNHEYKFDPEIRLNWIAGTGMTVLKDSVADIDNALWLIGRDDRKNEDHRLPMDELIKKVDISKPCILFAHQPGDIPDACRYGIPLTVCGHTHGGQVFPMNVLGRLLYTKVYGMTQTDRCSFYVTSGLGLSGFPLRISSHSEIVVFNIEIY